MYCAVCCLALSVMTTVRANASSGNGEAPAWFQQAAMLNNPSYDKEVPAVILRNEQASTLGADGVLTTTNRFAVRILLREGKWFAQASASYLQSSSKVRDIKAWLVRPDKTIKSFGKDSIVDRISDPEDIYNEYRLKLIDGSNDADAGTVFGYETIVEERPLFTQESRDFQDCSSRFCLPTLYSSYTLSLPAGWTAASVTSNHEEIKPTISGTSYTWELSGLPPVPPEPDSPSVRTMAPRIHVNYNPTTPSAANQVFGNWQDVSRWGSEMHSQSAILDDNIAAKARELTANSKTEFEKIRAVAGFVQNLRYISVDIGLGKGNGYRPRPASLVFQRGYGDCKDKANLMRTMLMALKIESYPVFIFSGDPTFVSPEWASPFQFNHCIIAVKVGDETNAPTVIKDEKLGRIMIFDATDPYTQLGDLPDHEQGSFALVVAGANGQLMKMPVLPPESSRLERQADAVLMPDGSLQGTIREQAYGQSASYFRAKNRLLSATDYQRETESWLSHRVTGAKLSKITPHDRPTDGRFDLDLEFAAAAYAQLMQGRLMMFRPAFVGRLDTLTVSDARRTHPVLLSASAYSESIKVKLPDGFVVDEMPAASQLETPFGKYHVTYEVKDGFLLFNRALTINKTEVTADKYETIKSFFAKVRTVEGDPVVLLKK